MRVLVASGSSGGHLFPAVAFLQELRRRFPGSGCLFVAPASRIILSPQECGCALVRLNLEPLRLRPPTRALRALWLYLKGCARAAFIVIEMRPEAVVGFGSFSSVPFLLLGWLTRAATLIHEQNVVPGRATRFLAFFADRICVSFPETAGYFRYCRRRVRVTGNPLRREFRRSDRKESCRALGIVEDAFTVLVMGGSQGSLQLNQAVRQTLGLLPDKERFQFIHICGPGGDGGLQEAYRRHAVRALILPFYERMQYCYGASDVAIVRAGALTVTELAVCRVPALLVPYPFARRHQEPNARFLQQRGGAIVVPAHELNAELLCRHLSRFLRDPAELRRMRAALEKIDLPDAAGAVCDELASLCAQETGRA